jgi:hypothetical protein
LSAPGIWTLNQQAAAQATNTWPFTRDPQFNYVTMLLHGDGSAGAVAMGSGAGTSSTVTNFNADASTNNFNVTINGDARSNNFTPYQGDGYYSSNMTSGYLTTASNADFALSGDFTVECWVFSGDSSLDGSTRRRIFHTGGGDVAASLQLLLGTSAGNSAVISVLNSGFLIDGTISVVTSSWNHVAVTRSGTSLKLFVNGVQSGSTATTSQNFNSGTSNTVYIGANSSGGGIWQGYISNLSVVNGTALYTSAFTPPTAPLSTGTTNQKLLVCQVNRFIDSNTATTAKTITVNSTPQVSPAVPFTLPTTVATYGSGYFDGTGDSLSLASSSTALPTGTQDFSVEMYLYWQTQGGSYPQLISNPTTNGFQIYYDVSAGALAVGIFNVSNVITYTIAQTALSGVWTHLVVTRSGNTFRMFVNGVLQANGTNTISFASLTTQYIASDGSRPYTGYMTDVRAVLGAIPAGYQTSSTTNGTSIFTPPTAPLTAVSGTALLTTQFNGGGNNSGFKDSSQFNFPITRNGNTTQGTFTPYSADWSNYFNGSSYFQIASTSVMNMNTYACVECWVNLSSSGANQLHVGRDSNYWVAYSFSAIGGSANKFVFSIYNGSAWSAVSSSTSPAVGTWYHVAGIRSGSTLQIYINGVLETTGTLSGTATTSATPIGIADNQGTSPMTGYLSNVRVNLGSTSAVLPYTANFTPSTVPLTAVTGTQLLTCQSNRFVDNSANALSLPIGGSPSVQGFSPFAPLTVYNPATYGGSGYFDGSGDWLSTVSTPQFDFGTGNFTLECWAWSNNFSSDYRLIAKVANISSYGSWQILIDTSGYPRFYASSAASSWDVASNLGGGVAIAANTWNHIAVTRSGTTFTIWVNGVSSGTTTSSASIYYSSAVTVTVGGMPDGTRSLPGYITDARISKGTAQYTSAFTPNTTPLTATTSTVLLTNTTNPAIFDNSMLNNLETVGNAAVSTSVKKYGAASMVFDGTGDYLKTVDNPSLDMGSGNFTIEGWVYITSSGASQTFIAKGTGADNQASYHIVFNGTNWLYYLSGNGSTWSIASGVVMGAGSVNNWQHLALVRNGSTFTPYVNGTAGTTTTSSTALFDSNKPFTVGADDAATQLLTGYIDDLRVTKGVARYTTTFTVPDQAFPNG